MISQRSLFLNHLAQTSDAPLALEIVKAKGSYMFDKDGKKYLDLISGISVSNIGHCHPKVVKAAQEQLKKYMHLMVYGEYIQSPQVILAKTLSDLLPDNLNSTYFVNSGSEAIEGAMKLAKRYTGRHEIISFKNAYHGSSNGSLSIMGNESFKQSFRPLLPGIKFLDYNNETQLSEITKKTAAVFAETIQGEAGVILPENNFLQKLQKKCNETGTLLVLDEIQTGFGRTGKMFGFENFDVIPDIITIAKGMGGGMPIGAFISSKEIMSSFTNNPILGHITTFGGHPVSCAAAIANIDVIINENLLDAVGEKEKLFKNLLVHEKIIKVKGKGLLLSVEFENFETLKPIIDRCVNDGLIVDWFLFADNCMRIAPPLNITKNEIINACKIIKSNII